MSYDQDKVVDFQGLGEPTNIQSRAQPTKRRTNTSNPRIPQDRRIPINIDEYNTKRHSLGGGVSSYIDEDNTVNETHAKNIFGTQNSAPRLPNALREGLDKSKYSNTTHFKKKSFVDEGKDVIEKAVHNYIKEIKEGLTDTIRTEATNKLKDVAKYYLNQSEQVVEDTLMHTHAKFVRAAYHNYNDIDVHEYLNHEDHAYAGIHKYRIDEQLSTKDNIVLFNAETGEAVMACRGTNPTSLGDWIVNAKLAFTEGGGADTVRFKEGVAQMEKVVAKYGKEYTSVSGHSQGAWLSAQLGQLFDIEGHHFDTAISPKMIRDNLEGLFKENTAIQTHYRVPGDLVSMLGYALPTAEHGHPLNKIKTIGHVVEDIKDAVSIHALSQYDPIPTSAFRETVNVARGSVTTSYMRAVKVFGEHAGTALGVGFDAYYDLRHGNIIESGVNMSIDMAKNLAEDYALAFIGAAGILGAPETGGTSTWASVAAGAATIAGMEYTAGVIKEATHDFIHNSSKETIEAVESTGYAIGDAVKDLPHELESTGYAIGDVAKSTGYAIGDAAKGLPHEMAHEFNDMGKAVSKIFNGW